MRDGKNGEVTVGQAVRDEKLDYEQSNRLFRNFKRGVAASPAPPPRRIDRSLWADRDAGRFFLRHLFQSLPYHADEIEQLVLTTPVASFENYLTWLNETPGDLAGDRIRIVDESAAALGYAVTEPEAIVLVFDFGGGTLDLSLVKLPESKEKTGGRLNRLLKSRNKSKYAAKIIAKAGQVIGDSDIDQWLLDAVLKKVNLSRQALGHIYAPLLTQCELAKIALSTGETSALTFEADGKTRAAILTRAELEALLEENGFKAAFSIDERRQLRLTVSDLKTGQELLNNVSVAALR